MLIVWRDGMCSAGVLTQRNPVFPSLWCFLPEALDIFG
jgi:hypothetical protein